MNKPWVIHPFIFSACPVLFLYVNNVSNAHIPITKVILYLSCVLMLSAILFYFLYISLKKNRIKTGIIISSFFNFLFYLPISPRFDVRASSILEMLVIPLLFIITYIIFAIICIATLRTSKCLIELTKFLNRVAVILLILVLVNGIYAVVIKNNSDPANASVIPQHSYRTSSQERSYPNIIYIVLDAYARQDILKGLYNYDNSDFISFLQNKGFYVATKSRANYNFTIKSIASSLNSKYLSEAQIKNDRTLSTMIKNNFIRNYLNAYGYKFVVFSSGYSLTEIDNADVSINYHSNLEFDNIVISRTIIGIILYKYMARLIAKTHRERIINTINRLPTVSKNNSRIFIFAHLMCPHPPFVFSKTELYSQYMYDDGSNLHLNKSELRQKYIEAYGEQVDFLNNKLKILINDLLAQGESSPIIILQSDHGPRSTLDYDSKKYNPDEASSILNAIYLPNGYEMLYESISPVNTFRIIRNEYFADYVGLLEDLAYLLK